MSGGGEWGYDGPDLGDLGPVGVLGEPRRELAGRNVKLAYWVVRRLVSRNFIRPGDDLDNAESWALYALCDAARLWDQTLNVRFATYATQSVWKTVTRENAKDRRKRTTNGTVYQGFDEGLVPGRLHDFTPADPREAAAGAILLVTGVCPADQRAFLADLIDRALAGDVKANGVVSATALAARHGLTHQGANHRIQVLRHRVYEALAARAEAERSLT